MPYVYKIINIETNEFYIGFRSANVRFKRTSAEDLLIYYFTSSKSLKNLIKETPEKFTSEILFTYDDIDVVYWYEQLSIKLHISNPLCLNKSYNDPDTNEKKFDTTKITPWNKGISPSIETRQLWSKQRKGKSNGAGKPKSADHIKKNKEAHNTPEYREKISNLRMGAGNGMSLWTYHTPNGDFISPSDAAIANSLNKETLIWRCKNNKQGFFRSITGN